MNINKVGHPITKRLGRRRRKKERNKMKYIDYALKKSLINNLFTICPFPSKELTESMSIIFAIKRYREIDKMRYNKNIVVYCLGDGVTPRTASLLASSSHWDIHSIDLALNNKRLQKRLKGMPDYMSRVHIHPIKSEEFTDIKSDCKLSIIVAVHSHAPFEEFWNRVPSPKIAFTVPCCIPHSISGLDPIEVYEDKYIDGAKRTVMIWKQ